MKKQKTNIGLAVCLNVGLFFAVCLSVSYVYQVGKLTESGYLIKKNQREIFRSSANIVSANGYLNEMSEISNESAAAGFVPSGDIVFVSLAQKRLSRAGF